MYTFLSTIYLKRRKIFYLYAFLFPKSCYSFVQFLNAGASPTPFRVVNAFTELQDPFDHAHDVFPVRGHDCRRGIAVSSINKVGHLLFCRRETQSPETVSIIWGFEQEKK